MKVDLYVKETKDEPARNAPRPEDELEWWWEAEDGMRHRPLFDLVRYLDKTQTGRQTRNVQALSLYQNAGIPEGQFMVLSEQAIAREATAIPVPQGVARYNAVKIGVRNTVTKVGKNKIRPQFLTSGGDWEQQERAKNLGKFIDGVFYANRTAQLAPLALKNACLFSKGFVKVIEHEGKIRHELVFSDEIKIDEVSGYYGKPPEMFQTKFIDRKVLLAQYKDDSEKCEKIRSCPRVSIATARSRTDALLVVEGWHLGDDGLRVMAIENCDLEAEPWKDDDFPFAELSYEALPVGFWGASMIDDLLGFHVDINTMLWREQEAIKLGSAPFMVLRGEDVPIEHAASNEIMRVVSLPMGTPEPQIVTPNPVSPALIEAIARRKEMAFEQIGMSQSAATNQKPAGLDSGRALREWTDIETETLALLNDSYQEFHLDLARKTIQAAKRAAKKNPEFSVTTHSKEDGVEQIRWADVHMDEDDYVMKVFPASALPQTPAFKLQTITELVSGGFIPQEMASDLMDFPDLEAASSLVNAPVQLVKKIMGRIITKGEYTQVEPEDNFNVNLKVAAQFYLKARLDGVPEEKLELIRRFLADTNAMMAQAQPPPLPAAPAPQGLPQPAPQGAA